MRIEHTVGPPTNYSVNETQTLLNGAENSNMITCANNLIMVRSAKILCMLNISLEKLQTLRGCIE